MNVRVARRGYSCAAPLLTGLVALLVMVLTTASAQTGGPLQPDFTTPSAAGAGPQVDPFTGSFSYGLPVMTVPGPNSSDYTITLAYHSGTSPDMGVPWVGYGWSLNPGAIVRNKQGFPDDWKDTVIYVNKTKPNWTVTGTARIGFEVASKDMGAKDSVSPLKGGAGYSAVVRFNNNLGYSMAQSFDAGVKGLANLSLAQTEDGGNWSWSGSISPEFLFTGLRLAGVSGYTEEANNGTRRFNALQTGIVGGLATQLWGTFGPKQERSYSFRSIPYTGHSTKYSFGLLINLPPWWLFGPEFGAKGSYTEQDPVVYQTLRGVGYMYSSDLQAPDMADYHLDKDGMYRPGAMLLGIPFSNADEYMITGGAMGSFRMFNRQPGTFRPNATTSSIPITQSSGDITVATRIGLGADIGIGSSTYSISELSISNGGTDYHFAKPDNNGVFFRFNNDGGGNVAFSDNDAAVHGNINNDNLLPQVPGSIYTSANHGETISSLGCISYNTNAQLNQRTDKRRSIYAFDKASLDTSVSSFVDRSEPDLASQIGEFSIAGAGGMRYTYGLPVYSKGEKDLRYGIDRLARDSASRINSRYVCYAHTDEASAPTVVGEKRFAPYATMHLLTSITTPDYKDLTYNGPTSDDLGGYTKFNYVRTAGGRNKRDSGWTDDGWYYWRIPYNGMLYDANQLSTPDDDMGTVSSGRREEYYLQSIETKTHIAIFVTNGTDVTTNGKHITGSGAIRQDGYTAGHNFEDRLAKDVEQGESGDSTFTRAGGTLPNALRHLERIELYTKDTSGLPDSLLATTFFDYDYSLRPGMPNSNRPAPDSSRVGVLTLRSVWSQQQRVHSQRISPYVFGYQYRPSTSYPSNIRSLYPQVTHFADSLTKADQNPPYRITDVDRWGNYARNGAARYSKRNPWVDQNPDTNHFDPAAWQLKTVKSPTGAELQVQYEQNRYSYVQDRPAMGMVSLRHFPGNDSSFNSFDTDNDNRYFINLADVGIADTDNLSVLKYQSLLRKEFTDSTSLQRAYFKFLYALVGDSAKLDNPEYNSEYISGYGGIDSVNVAQVSSSPNRYGLWMTIRAPGGGGYAVPKQVCLDFVKKNRRGLLEGENGIANTGNSLGIVTTAVSHAFDAQFDPGKYCKHVDFEHSYIRLPLMRAKLGGGVRVKRLLTLDPGTERDTTLLGTEYVYETYDRDRGEDISSGVAVNEPSVGGEENALFNVPHFNARPDLDTKIIAGADLEEYEMPLGKSLLPGASVGYSRVVTKSIFNGRTQPGFSVQEFYTAKEYPFSRRFDTTSKSIDFTDIISKSVEPFSLDPVVSAGVSYVSPVGFGVHNDEKHQLSMQGYRFILNAMHGQPRRSSSYGGFYEKKNTWALSGLQEYQYFQPGEKIPLIGKISDSIVYGSIGKEMEVVSESKAASDYTNDFSIQVDVTANWLPPFAPLFNGSLQSSTRDYSLATHVINKIVQYPALVKSVLTYGDGMYHLAENVAFSSTTGQPLITHSSDGYDKLILEKSPSGHKGGYFSYSIPATEYYPALGAKSSNQRVKIFNGSGLTITKDTVGGKAKLLLGYTDAGRLFGALRQCVPGSLLYLRGAGTDVSHGLYHVDSVRDTIVYLLPVSKTQFAALDSSHGTVDVEVLESGYANMSGASVGGFTTYGESKSDVVAGSTIGVAGTTGFSTLEGLVNRMNAIVTGGGGYLDTSEMAGVSFLIGGSCHAMTDSIWLLKGSNSLHLQRFKRGTDTLICQSRFPYLSGHSRFVVDDDGALGYEGDTGVRFPIGSCFAFCLNPSVHRVRTISNVIAAGAQTLGDTIPYTRADYPALASSDGNKFELGMSNRWTSRMGYGYRTSVIRGSQHGSNERNYANAGVFDDFTLFDWNNPSTNDTTKWLKGDSVTLYSPHGDVLETKTPLGIYSTTKLGYGNTLPILIAGNATYNSVAFESFESGFAFPSKLRDTAAHSGKYCLYAPPNMNVDSVMHVRMTSQIASKGLEIKFWMRATDNFHIDSADANIKIKLLSPGPTLPIPMTQWQKIARTGSWTLYEIAVHNLAFRVDTDDIRLMISRADTAHPIWFDDIRMGPYDAAMRCFVFDAKTYRPLTVFDDDHFGLYSQYNAEGAPVRTIIETAEGIRTVAEAQGHVPLIDRSTSYDMAARKGGGGEGGTVYDIGHHSLPYREDEDAEPGTAGTKIDLLNVDISATRQRATVLGGKTPELPSVDSLKMPSLQQSPELQRLEALGRLKALWTRTAELEKQAQGDLSDEARQQLDAESQAVRNETSKIIARLGIPEEELQRLYSEWASQKEDRPDGK